MADDVGFSCLRAKQTRHFSELAFGSTGRKLSRRSVPRLVGRDRDTSKGLVLSSRPGTELLRDLLQPEGCIKTARRIHQALRLCELEILPSSQERPELEEQSL